MRNNFWQMVYTRVGYYQSVLEGEGIKTIVRNKDLNGSGITEVPIPEFFPALCVMNEEDYEPALEILRRHVTENAAGSETEHSCVACGEINPGNFYVCWSCGKEVAGASDEPEKTPDHCPA